jgi:hypothetical protein
MRLGVGRRGGKGEEKGKKRRVRRGVKDKET